MDQTTKDYYVQVVKDAEAIATDAGYVLTDERATKVIAAIIPMIGRHSFYLENAIELMKKEKAMKFKTPEVAAKK